MNPSLLARTGLLFDKIRWSLHYRFRSLRIRLFGKTIICSECGQPIGPVILSSRQGKIQLECIGAYQVFVDFASREELHFRHVDQGECRRISPPVQK